MRQYGDVTNVGMFGKNMSEENFRIGGRVSFHAKVKGERGRLLDDADDMLLDVASYAEIKYPQYEWKPEPIAISQKLSEKLRS